MGGGWEGSISSLRAVDSGVEEDLEDLREDRGVRVVGGGSDFFTFQNLVRGLVIGGGFVDFGRLRRRKARLAFTGFKK